MTRCMCCSHAQTDHNVHGCMLDGCHCPSFERAGDASPGPTRPGYQHSPATYVEGREAPEGDTLVGAGAYPPRSARREGREAPRRAGRAMQLPTPSAYGDDGEMAEPVEVVSEPAPDLEACARAAYAVGRKHWAGDPHWEHLPRVTAEHWCEVARAVLAAAKGAGR